MKTGATDDADMGFAELFWQQRPDLGECLLERERLRLGMVGVWRQRHDSLWWWVPQLSNESTNVW